MDLVFCFNWHKSRFTLNEATHLVGNSFCCCALQSALYKRFSQVHTRRPGEFLVLLE
jgi:hypothetical protein